MGDYRIVSGSTHGLADATAFLEGLALRADALPDRLKPYFADGREIVVTRAPGRLDLMGGIADYSGSVVLEWPIANGTMVALQRDPSKTLTIASLNADPDGTPRLFEMPMAAFTQNGLPATYALLRQRFEDTPADRWAAYVAGAFLVLMRERRTAFQDGARILIESNVPEGKGLASSAALEVAVMQAVGAAFGIPLTPRDMALRCQQVENLIANAPCGVMDQMTSAAADIGRLIEILCQPADLEGTVKLPDALDIWGIDSGLRHTVAGESYVTVRTAAFMGYRLIADMAGLAVRDLGNGHVRIEDPDWHGYLANIKPRFFEDFYAGQLPHAMPGSLFLQRYGGITDPVTRVRPDGTYPVFAATRHPIYEHVRTTAFSATLKSWRGMDQAALLGGLMYQSHDSYSACGLGSPATDLLVDLVREIGSPGGLYGAKVTGGGNGGTVAVLGKRGADATVEKVAERYAERTKHQPTIIGGSSPGAAAFGHLKIIAGN